MILCCLWALNACSTEPAAPASVSAASTADAGPTYLVATEASYAPFEFRDENGLVIGYDVDILNAVAADQGFKVRFINQRWDGIFDTLNTGERHIVAAALGVTEERRQQFALSDPYGSAPNMVVYLNPEWTLQNPGDLKKRTVVIQSDTSVAQQLQAAGVSHIHTTPTLYLALKQVLNHQADAVAGDSAVLRYYLKNLPDIQYRSLMLPEPSGDESIVFALKKDNTELLAKINAGLANIKANGTYAKINEKWFGAMPPAAASTASEP